GAWVILPSARQLRGGCPVPVLPDAVPRAGHTARSVWLRAGCAPRITLTHDHDPAVSPPRCPVAGQREAPSRRVVRTLPDNRTWIDSGRRPTLADEDVRRTCARRRSSGRSG